MTTIEDAIKYGEEAVARKDLYIWGANGEKVLDLLPRLNSMETSISNANRVLSLLSKNVKNGADIHKMRGEDCSGLWVRFLEDEGILSGDTTADGLYKAIKNPIKVDKVQAGDFVFHKSEGSSAWTHVGMVVGNGYVIESKGRDYGVVKTKLKGDYNWNGAARPKWWSGGVVVIKRKLKYVAGDMMKGDDVLAVQNALDKLGFNLGSVDGVYGPRTEQAVMDFQVSKKLRKVSYGSVDATTANALGLKYEA